MTETTRLIALLRAYAERRPPEALFSDEERQRLRRQLQNSPEPETSPQDLNSDDRRAGEQRGS